MKNKIVKGSIVCAIMLILPTMIMMAEEEIDYTSLERDEYIKILESLPYFLEGSVLDGNTRVVVTENGETPDFIDISKYDIVISRDERTQIINNKHEEFIIKHGIDPYPPDPILDSISDLDELQDVNDIDGLYESKAYRAVQEQEEGWVLGQVSVGDGPHESFGQMFLAIFIPTDSAHRPNNPNFLILKCVSGWHKFDEFDIDILWFEMWGYWDASDVGTDSYDQLWDFHDDYISLGINHPYYCVNMGLVKRSEHNGIAFLNDFWCLVAEDCIGGFEHNKARISQHELTHCIGDIKDDDGWWPWDHSWRSCVVNYFYMFIGVNHWCNVCGNKLYDEIWM